MPFFKGGKGWRYRSLTSTRPWKMVVERRSFPYWEGNFPGVNSLLNFGRLPTVDGWFTGSLCHRVLSRGFCSYQKNPTGGWVGPATLGGTWDVKKHGFSSQQNPGDVKKGPKFPKKIQKILENLETFGFFWTYATRSTWCTFKYLLQQFSGPFW